MDTVEQNTEKITNSLNSMFNDYSTIRSKNTTVLVTFRRAILAVCETLVNKSKTEEEINIPGLIQSLVTQVEWVDNKMGWDKK